MSTGPASNNVKGNLGTPILSSLIKSASDSKARFRLCLACVQSEASEQRLNTLFPPNLHDNLVVARSDKAGAIRQSHVIILAVDPSAVEATLKEDGVVPALKGKLLISVAAGW